MRRLPLQPRTVALMAVIVPLLALFLFVATRSGPLAPVAVTVTTVESRAIAPELFGVGGVESRYTHRIGPTFAGRIRRLDVQVGDAVRAGQLLGEMDAVDLDDRVRSQESALRRAEAGLQEALARQLHARTQANRYEKLFSSQSTTEEILEARRQESQIADAALSAAREELSRARADRDGWVSQRRNLRLVAPVAGVVASRDADPGTTIVAGQTVVEIIDPKSLWVNVRFDQVSAAGLAAGLPARIVLRSRNGEALEGRVLRVEPKADVVTEEALAKVVFAPIPHPAPLVGELAEVTVALPVHSAAPSIPNAAVRRLGEKIGVWQLVDGGLRFTPLRLGASDLAGFVQVREGLREGARIVTYSEKALTARSRVRVVEHIKGAPR